MQCSHRLASLGQVSVELTSAGDGIVEEYLLSHEKAHEVRKGSSTRSNDRCISSQSSNW
jgi:hypothetical protein